MKVLVAPDKFKGSLTAVEVADHLAKGLAEAGADVWTLPLADGGDGSVAAALASGFAPCPVTVHGATGQGHSSVVAFDADTAIVEVANTCGLSTLPGGIRAPITASSYGFGEAIRAALTLARGRLVLALGGSASTDGGIGMLAALGYRFLDRTGGLLAPVADNLDLIHRVDDRGALNLSGVDVIVAGDVTSPLLGLTGAADDVRPPERRHRNTSGQTRHRTGEPGRRLRPLRAHRSRRRGTRTGLGRRRRHRVCRHAVGRHHHLGRRVLPGPAGL